MVEVVCGVRMGVGLGSVGKRGEGVDCSGGSVSVADGGRARLRDCCRFPNGTLGELWEDFPYRLPFTLGIRNVFL